MIKVMILEDIKEIPRGLTLWGSVPNSQGKEPQEIAESLNQSLDNIHSLTYLDRTGNYSSLPIEDFQITSSIGGNFVLVFFLGQIDLPSDLTPGTIIYRGQPQPSPSNSPELSVSSQ